MLVEELVLRIGYRILEAIAQVVIDFVDCSPGRFEFL